MATLYINKSDSYCGSCGLGANPSEKTHETVFGWGLKNDKWNKKGCGVRYTHVSSEYSGNGVEPSVRNMRPDLEWAGGVW